MSTGLNPGDVVRCPQNGHVFECVKLLRQCRCGEVWFAVRAAPAGEVVLKIIDKEALELLRSEDEEHRRVSFESPTREFRTLMFLDFHRHPHVVRARGPTFEVEGRLVCVMEFLPGGDLLELLARHKRFDEGTARHFFQQIAKGLRYMHGLRVAHLDVSLENVGLSRDYRVAKLLDFGLATRIGFDEVTGREVLTSRGARGKLFYVAPEVYSEQPFMATKADMWSLGIVLFMMLTGSPPLESGPCDKDPRFPFIKNRQISVILEAWRMRHQVSDQVVDLLNGLLSVDPRKRLTLQQAMTHPWVVGTGVAATAANTAANTAAASASAGAGGAGAGADSGGGGIVVRPGAGRAGVVAAAVAAKQTGSAESYLTTTTMGSSAESIVGAPAYRFRGAGSGGATLSGSDPTLPGGSDDSLLNLDFTGLSAESLASVTGGSGGVGTGSKDLLSNLAALDMPDVDMST